MKNTMKSPAKITGLLVDVENGIARKATLSKTLDGYYKALNCSMIDIVSRWIGGKRFDIICDDEALFKDSPRTSAIGMDYVPMLYGNLFVVAFDGRDDVCSLSDAQIAYLLKLVVYFKDKAGNVRPCLTRCDY